MDSILSSPTHTITVLPCAPNSCSANTGSASADVVCCTDINCLVEHPGSWKFSGCQEIEDKVATYARQMQGQPSNSREQDETESNGVSGNAALNHTPGDQSAKTPIVPPPSSRSSTPAGFPASVFGSKWIDSSEDYVQQDIRRNNSNLRSTAGDKHASADSERMQRRSGNMKLRREQNMSQRAQPSRDVAIPKKKTGVKKSANVRKFQAPTIPADFHERERRGWRVKGLNAYLRCLGEEAPGDADQNHTEVDGANSRR